MLGVRCLHFAKLPSKAVCSSLAEFSISTLILWQIGLWQNGNATRKIATLLWQNENATLEIATLFFDVLMCCKFRGKLGVSVMGVGVVD